MKKVALLVTATKEARKRFPTAVEAVVQRQQHHWRHSIFAATRIPENATANPKELVDFVKRVVKDFTHLPLVAPPVNAI